MSWSPNPEPSAPTSAWAGEALLADGSPVHLRPIAPGDQERHARFVEGLSPESQFYRFFQPRGPLTAAEIEHFCTVDHVDRMAYVGLVGDDIVGVARFERLDDHRAEAAFIVADAYQGRGLGTLLLERLADAGRGVGIDTFTAEVLAGNRRMLDVFRNAGFGVRSGLEPGGTVHVELDLTPTPALRDAVDRRRQVAARHAAEQADPPTAKDEG